jgi:ribulose 1,5-bisphosphate synthetase/thiazole synthase
MEAWSERVTEFDVVVIGAGPAGVVCRPPGRLGVAIVGSHRPARP